MFERHGRRSTIVSSNRDPSEWMTMTSDTILAQSAIDRLTQGAHVLVIEGPSWRQRGNREKVRSLDDGAGGQ
ncbi:ATP-binding protein [Glutamicibacter soli]